MNKAGGILGIIGGVFGVIAAVVTLFVGGMGSAFNAQGASTVVGLGWGGIGFSIASIVFGATAFAKPKGSGICLILVSLAGTILGGTIVAVCMVISLIGGVLAVLAKKPAPRSGETTTLADTPVEIASKRKPYRTIAVVAAAGLLGILAIGALTSGNKPATVSDRTSQTAPAKIDPLEALAISAPISLQPTDSALVEMFSFGSKNTDIQRENALRELRGKTVAWELPVFDVQRRGNNYRIQATSTRQNVGAFITLTPRNDTERTFIEGLTTGQKISFKGVIKDTTVRNFNIEPAVLAARPTVQGRTGGFSTVDWSRFTDGHPHDVLSDPQVREHVERLLGSRFKEFLDKMEVASSVQRLDDYVYGNGCAPHMCGSMESLFVLNTRTGELLALIGSDDKESVAKGEEVEILAGDNMTLPNTILKWAQDWDSKF